MAKSQITIVYNNELRAWRELRELTQEQLGEAIGTTGSVISLLEAGKRQLTPKWLNKLAIALRTSPTAILEVPPKNLPVELMDVWAAIPEATRPQALAILKTFAR
jgi:transcriptional regulator with XRE-family HTH domain